jgi:F0F1-type ATP synthase assembly protein I
MTAGPRRDDAWSGMGTGWAISATLLGGMLAWGGVGYLADRLLGTEHIFTGVGFVLGGAGAIYAVYLRYGRGDGDEGGA